MMQIKSKKSILHRKSNSKINVNIYLAYKKFSEQIKKYAKLVNYTGTGTINEMTKMRITYVRNRN